MRQLVWIFPCAVGKGAERRLYPVAPDGLLTQGSPFWLASFFFSQELPRQADPPMVVFFFFPPPWERGARQRPLVVRPARRLITEERK